jgi:hypothetical protein
MVRRAALTNYQLIRLVSQLIAYNLDGALDTFEARFLVLFFVKRLISIRRSGDFTSQSLLSRPKSLRWPNTEELFGLKTFVET